MSYEYLEENVIPVKLAKEVGRVEEKIVSLKPKEEERAKRSRFLEGTDVLVFFRSKD